MRMQIQHQSTITQTNIPIYNKCQYQHLKLSKAAEQGTCMQPLPRQALTMEGTTPSIVTPAAATNSPNGLVSGDPCGPTTAFKFITYARMLKQEVPMLQKHARTFLIF